VEPSTGVADVLVRIERRGERVRALIENPFAEEQQHRSGNKMALANIRERMELLYPGRSSVEASRIGDEYIVRLRFPCVEDSTRISSL